MKIKFKIVIIAVLLVLKSNVIALTYGGCDYKDISTLKSMINNINISYTYEIKDNDAYFDITLTNVPNNVYFIDTYDKKRYEYSDTNNGEITIKSYNNVTSGQFNFYINNGICNDIKLGNKYYKFPIYNKRYSTETCRDLEDYYLCKRWVSKYYSDSEFEEKIQKYRETKQEEQESDKIIYKKDFISEIVEFYIKYYYYFLPGIIIISGLIMIISKKKNSFKL